MIQLCYASKSSSAPEHLLTDLREILSEAQSFNALNGINGVLFYADQYFFQCLEGPRAGVLALFERIKTDRRHHQVVELGNRDQSNPEFKDWSMKFVRRNSEVSEFFHAMGHQYFNPVGLGESHLKDFLKILTRARQETQA